MIATPMQPVYITGHSRPVRKVLHNHDGDLLFSCSDDGTVCVFDTHQCERVAVFEIREAVKSISVTKDSKYLVCAPTTKGIYLYNVQDGKKLGAIQVPGNLTKHVALSYSDKYVLVIYETHKVNFIRVYRFSDILKENNEDVKPVHEIKAPEDVVYTDCVWGPLDKSLYISTNFGKVLFYDLDKNRFENEEQVHKDEIFSLSLTHDFSMMTTSSRDGTAKLLNPKDLSTVRQFIYGKPCRTSSVSPLFDDPNHQKFHILCGGGQDAQKVTTTTADQGGFEMKMWSVIFEEQLAETHGHFGPVHSIDFSPDGYAFASGAEDGYVHYHKFPPEYFTKKFE